MAPKIAVVIASSVSKERVGSMDNAHFCLMGPSLKVAHIISIHTPWEELNYVDPCTARRPMYCKEGWER